MSELSPDLEKKIELKGMDLNEIGVIIKNLREKPFRAKQLYKWLYRKSAFSFDEMSDLPLILRNYLPKRAELKLLEPKKKVSSKIDASTKYLFKLRDGNCIESVYMEYQGRKTVCLSTQVGCSLNCSFCSTGKMGFIRNLTTGEILDQFLFINRESDFSITNIVFMGMGEPFLNYENVIKAARILNSELGPEISARKITISTSGIVPAIYRFADEGHKFKLAISLNATTDAQRDKSMPINRKYPINVLLEAAKYYTRKTKRRVTFEYVLIKDFNDSIDDAKRLRKLLSDIPCKLNLIPYNETEFSPYKIPDEERLEKFIKEIHRAPFAVTVRRSQGRDIKGACGQLYLQTKNE